MLSCKYVWVNMLCPGYFPLFWQCVVLICILYKIHIKLPARSFFFMDKHVSVFSSSLCYLVNVTDLCTCNFISRVLCRTAKVISFTFISLWVEIWLWIFNWPAGISQMCRYVDLISFQYVAFSLLVGFFPTRMQHIFLFLSRKDLWTFLSCRHLQ